mgnify:CR=1 FL=1
MTATTTSYDELPYTDNSFHYTHPDHMATVGLLHGLAVARPERCRVLELGCAMGGNLIPMALKFPEASFLGIDLSARQIDEGRATVAELGLGNVELRAAGILDVDADWGRFDYVVCHGVYSWVPAAVREKILAIFAENLAPGGMAYVSYNTFPGWHARGLARDLLAFHLRRGADVRDSPRLARAFLKDLAAILPDRRAAYAAILAGEGRLLDEVDDAYLFHEHLEETNAPFYFHQFMADAAARGLGFVAEARTDGLREELPPEARARIDEWGDDPIAREQYLDFVVNRTFRRTFLRREADGPPPRPSPAAVAGMAVGTAVMPESPDLDVLSPDPTPFRTPGGGPSLTTNHPLLKAAFLELALARPRMIPFDELLALALDRLKAGPVAPFDPAEAAAHLREALFRGFATELTTLSVAPPRIATDPGDAPTASPLARLQAARGGLVVNAAGRSVAPEDLDLFLLPLLDGARPRAALHEALRARIVAGDFSVSTHDGPVPPAELDRAVPALVDAGLRRLAALGVLVA